MLQNFKIIAPKVTVGCEGKLSVSLPRENVNAEDVWKERLQRGKIVFVISVLVWLPEHF